MTSEVTMNVYTSIKYGSIIVETSLLNYTMQHIYMTCKYIYAFYIGDILDYYWMDIQCMLNNAYMIHSTCM